MPVPAAPATVGAYLASLKDSHAPITVRRRPSAIGKMHRFNDQPWNPGHRDIQEPLQGLLRERGRAVQKAAALTLAMLRQLVATCDASARGRRDRALLLIGFAGALRRSELVALQVEDVVATQAGCACASAAARAEQRNLRQRLSRFGHGLIMGGMAADRKGTAPISRERPWRARRPRIG